MKIRSDSAIAVCGKKKMGKTTWIKKHLEAIPAERLYILDFNQNDYQDLIPKLGPDHIWNYEGGGQQECEDFMNTVYGMGNVFIVLEEGDNYLHHKTPTVVRFVSTIRNRGSGHIDNFKRPMSVLPDFRGAYDTLVLFQCTSPEDIDYLERWAGTGKGSLERLRTLGLGEHIIVDLNPAPGQDPISPVKKLKI
jgi:hypothetical protein